MASFLRIDGIEVCPLQGRLLWQGARAGDEDGLVVYLAAAGGRHLIHLAAWLPGEDPSELSGRELTMLESGTDAALDGRLFRALLVRFGRVDGTRAVLSIDGEAESMDPESESTCLVAADLVCRVAETDAPAFCNRCGASLEGDHATQQAFVGGRLVELRRPRPTCAECVSAGNEGVPVRCSTCGLEYAPGEVEWASDERTLAYTSTCAQGHTVSGTGPAPAA